MICTGNHAEQALEDAGRGVGEASAWLLIDSNDAAIPH